MNTLILATTLAFITPTEAASEAVNCDSLERYAAVIMNARQSGLSKDEVSSQIYSVSSAYQPAVSHMVTSVYKKPRFLYSESDRLEAVNQFSAETALNCYVK